MSIASAATESDNAAVAPSAPEELKLEVGHVYRGHKPTRTGSFFNPVVNDRQILWIGAFELQYDSPTVKNGHRYKRMLISDFRKWAAQDVTEQMPEGDWASWTKFEAERAAAKEAEKAAKAAAKQVAKPRKGVKAEA